MDRNTSKPTGDPDRFNPNRGQNGYVPRQTTYYSSSSNPSRISLPSPPPNQIVAQASEAALRVITDKPPSMAPKPSMSSVSSFDMLVPKKLVEAPPEQTILAVRPAPALNIPQQSIKPPAHFAPADIRPSVHSALPTDLMGTFAIDPVETVDKKYGKFNLGLPKLSMPKLLVGAFIVLFAVGAVITFLSLRTNQDVVAQVKSVARIQPKTDNDGGMTSGVPDEQGNPPSVDYYRTAASYPRVIRIPKIRIEARVLALAIAPTGALKAPANIFDAGWYKDSARPGETGAMVIDGHASGPTKPGLLKNIGKLVKGDKIEIERGDGESFTYTVQTTKVFDAEKLDMSSVMVPIVPGKSGLNILTSGGKFDEAANKYEQRTVVYAVIN